MKNEIIIDKYGLGHAVLIRNKEKIIDSFLDPPLDACFYPPNTFINAKILRKVKNMGGFFVRLPSGQEGFLRSNKRYHSGDFAIMRSKVFFDLNKPQIFTDKLQTKSRYFILGSGRKGLFFSKKIVSKIQRDRLHDIIKAHIRSAEDLYLICRFALLDLGLNEIKDELEKIIYHLKNIVETVKSNKVHYDSLARKEAMQAYDSDSSFVIEQDGSFELLGIWDLLRGFSKKRVELDESSYLILEHTSAFSTIDVNSGANAKISQEELNLKACDEICSLVKLLGFGGKIVIDFLPCSITVRTKILKKMVQYFSKDDAKTKIWGWTKGGIFEFERERDKSPLELLLPDN